MTVIDAGTEGRPERRAVTVAPDFDATPSVRHVRSVEISVVADVPAGAGAVAFPVGSDGTGASRLGVELAALKTAGFDGNPGQTHAVVGGAGPLHVAVGVGDPATIDAHAIRDAAGPSASVLATRRQARLAARVPILAHVDAGTAAQMIVEGILLARYRFGALKTGTPATALTELTLIARADEFDAVTRGAARGRHLAGVGLARDLANAPATLLTARRFADIAKIGADSGLEIEVIDEKALAKLGCGGLLGVNAGSARRHG